MANRRVWVTGASAGIGAALADVLLRRGARVALTARRHELLNTFATRYDPSRVLVLPADVTDRASVDAAERIVRGLERGKKEISFPAPMAWALKLMRVLPYPVYERVIKMQPPPPRSG